MARPADLTAERDAHGAISDGADVELRALHLVEVAELLHGEPLDAEGA